MDGLFIGIWVAHVGSEFWTRCPLLRSSTALPLCSCWDVVTAVWRCCHKRLQSRMHSARAFSQLEVLFCVGYLKCPQQLNTLPDNCCWALIQVQRCLLLQEGRNRTHATLLAFLQCISLHFRIWVTTRKLCIFRMVVSRTPQSVLLLAKMTEGFWKPQSPKLDFPNPSVQTLLDTVKDCPLQVGIPFIGGYTVSA